MTYGSAALFLFFCYTITRCDAFVSISSKHVKANLPVSSYQHTALRPLQNHVAKLAPAMQSGHVVAQQQAAHTTSKAYLQLVKFLPFLQTFVDPSILGGLLAGGLHAVTGIYSSLTMS